VEGRVYRIDNPKVKVMYGGATKASFYKLSNDVSIYKQVLDGCSKTMTKDDLKKMGLKVFEETDCVVCLCEKPNVVFNICGHMCVCKECHKSACSDNKCPVCNTRNTMAFPMVDGAPEDEDAGSGGEEEKKEETKGTPVEVVATP